MAAPERADETTSMLRSTSTTQHERGLSESRLAALAVGSPLRTFRQRCKSLLFALGAALTGIIVNALGFERMTQPEELRTAAFWLFAGFVPPALIGNLIAWRFSNLIAGGRRLPPRGQ